jgi:hypothetical protein
MDEVQTEQQQQQKNRETGINKQAKEEGNGYEEKREME